MTYRACVYGGVLAGIGAAVPFATRVGLTPLLWLAIAAFASCVAFAFAAITKVLVAKETFSFLHYQIVVFVTTAALLAAFDAPLLPALDLLALCLAVTQSIGRIGCAVAGCCHGRPSRIGVRCREGRVAAHWARARVIPVQLIESAALVAIAVFTARALETPGTALAMYATSYAGVRFTTELLRGDVRRHVLGLSEAQWICAVTGVVFARGAFALAFVIAAVAVAMTHRLDVDAIARALYTARRSNAIAVAAGLRISHAITEGIEHYTLSGSSDIGSLAALVRDLAHPDAHVSLVRGSEAHHVIVGGRS